MTAPRFIPSSDSGFVRVWDPFVRLFHWSVVGACALNLTLLNDGKLAHRWLGYGVMALLALRLVWGVVGSRHARFRDFVPGPRGLLVYLGAMARGREPRFRGHNPAAAVMILVLMTLLGVIGVTGWMMTLDAFWGVEWVEDLHKGLANGLIVLVAIHVAAAVLESLRHRENLILAMITGRKRL
jgi:cytochrome b